MFDADYFKDLINETTALMTDLEKADDSSREDLQAKIEANIITLKFLADEIEDDDLRTITLKRIEVLFNTSEELEISRTRPRSAKTDGDEDTQAYDKDILEHSKTLRGKAEKLLRSLKIDDDVITDIRAKMEGNLAGAASGVKDMKQQGNGFSTFSIFVFTVAIFLAMYILIRFC